MFVFDTKETCSYNFNKQRERILAGTDIFGPTYSKVMRDMKWYDESRLVRDNKAHFLGGFTAIQKDEHGEPRPIYFSFPIIDNWQGDLERIEIDIGRAVETYNEGFNTCLHQVGKCYLDYLGPDTIMQIPNSTFQNFTAIKLSDVLSGKIKLSRVKY